MNEKFNIEIPYLQKLVEKIENLTSMVEELQHKSSLNQEWYSLKEACELKGINCNSINNSVGRKYQPNFGIADTLMSGRKWHRKTIEKWIKLSGEDIDELWKNK